MAEKPVSQEALDARAAIDHLEPRDQQTVCFALGMLAGTLSKLAMMNEHIPTRLRLQRLAERIWKWGHS